MAGVVIGDRVFAQRAASTRHEILVGALIVCIVASIAVTTNRTIYFIGAFVALAGLAMGLMRWRWSIYGLLLYLPISGIPSILTYPRTQAAVLLKDIIFVLPAYLGFVVARRGQSLFFPGAPVAAMSGLAGLVVVQCIRQISNPLAAMIGVKIWLFYIPMLFLGYYLPTSRSQLLRLLGAMSWAGCLPLVLGIVEAVLIVGGMSDTVYSWYGPAAQSATQDFANVGPALGVGLLGRVPSTFTFISQYYDFASVMIVVAFAWWRFSGSRLGLLPLTLAVTASLTSGARAAFVMTPLLVGLIAILAGRYRQAVAIALTLGVGAVVTLVLLGLDAIDVVSASFSVGSSEIDQGFLSGIPEALGLTATGFGTGYATNASRYALDPSVANATFALFESWWVKTILELGLAGLVTVVALLGALIARGIRSHFDLSDGGWRGLSASLLALLLWTIVYATKGVEIDIDPIDVYFWLFAGILLRLPDLVRGHRAEESPARIRGEGRTAGLDGAGGEPA